MKLEFRNNATQGRLIMTVNDSGLKGEGLLNGGKENVNTFAVNKSTRSRQVTIDGISFAMPGHSILPLVSNQHFVFETADELVAWQFNREFYCLADHDAEIGCIGFLFYGVHHPVFIALDAAALKNVNIVQGLFLQNLKANDEMQEEMLRTLLKLLIITSTRIAKAQTMRSRDLSDDRWRIIRQFNFLVEKHFKQQHEISFYAKQLSKSPKTLTNLFRLGNYPRHQI